MNSKIVDQIRLDIVRFGDTGEHGDCFVAELLELCAELDKRDEALRIATDALKKILSCGEHLTVTNALSKIESILGEEKKND